LIYSSVLRKCFFGFSRLAAFGSWPVCRFEWMSSIRLLRCFVVAYIPAISVRFLFAARRGKAYRYIPLVEVIHVAIQNPNEQLN
jgi:hypothetical protein